MVLRLNIKWIVMCIVEGLETRTIYGLEMLSDLPLGEPCLYTRKSADERTQHRRCTTYDSSSDDKSIYSVQRVSEILRVSTYEYKSVALKGP